MNTSNNESDLNTFDDDDDDDDGDIHDFLSDIDGKELTVVGKLDDDDDDDLEFDALRITRTSGTLLFRDSILEDAVELGAENNNFIQNMPDAVIVNGGEGNDSLTGAAGDDFLIGGAGIVNITLEYLEVEDWAMF